MHGRLARSILACAPSSFAIGKTLGRRSGTTRPSPCSASAASTRRKSLWSNGSHRMEIPAGIFPYKSRSVGTAFHQTCDALGIEDLHFHDLRHEGTITRLRQFRAASSVNGRSVRYGNGPTACSPLAKKASWWMATLTPPYRHGLLLLWHQRVNDNAD